MALIIYFSFQRFDYNKKSEKPFKKNIKIDCFFVIIFPFLQVSSAFDSLDGCLPNWGRLPHLNEGLVASTIWPSFAERVIDNQPLTSLYNAQQIRPQEHGALQYHLYFIDQFYPLDFFVSSG